MVDLPIPQPENVTTQTPNPGVTAGDIARSGGYIAQGLDKLGQGLQVKARGFEQLAEGTEDLAVPFAQQAGRASVQRNPDGSVTAAPTFIMGKAGDAFEAAQTSSAGPIGRSKIDEDLAGLRNQHLGDPQGAQVAFQNYIGGLSKTYGTGPLGAAMSGYAQMTAAQHFTQIADQSAQANFEADAQAKNERVKQLNNTINGMTYGGRGDQAGPYMQERSDILDSMQHNPLYKFNADQRVNADQEFKLSNVTAGIAGKWRTQYEKDGNLGNAILGAEKDIKEVEGLSTQQQLSAVGEVYSRLRGVYAGHAQQNEELKNGADGIIYETQHGGNVDDATLDATRQTLWGNRLYAKAAEVEAAKCNQKLFPTIAYGTADQATAALLKVRGLASERMAAGMPGVTDVMAGAGAGGAAHGNNPGNIIDGPFARSLPGYAGANGRFAAFDTVEHGAGAMAANLHSYAGQGIQTLNQLTARWAPAGDGANNPVAYAKRISDATGIDPNAPIDLRDPDTVAKIIPAMATVEQGHAVGGLGGTSLGGPDQNVVPAWKSLLEATSKNYDFNAGRLWDNIKGGWSKENPGSQPTPDQMHDLVKMAPYVSDPKLKAEMKERLDIEAKKPDFLNGTLQQQRDHIQAAQILGSTNGADNIERKMLEELTTHVNFKTSLAKDNPVEYAERFVRPNDTAARPAPLDLSSPDAFAQSLQSRQTWKGYAKAVEPDAGDNIIGPNEKDAIVGAMRGPAQQASMVLGGLASTLKPEEMGAALQDKDIKEGVTGLLRSNDPGKMAAAVKFMDGQWQQNPLTFKAQFGETAYSEFRTAQANLQLTPDALNKRMLAANDPNQAAAEESLKKVADEALKGVSASSVVSKFNTGIPFTPIGTTAQAPVGDPDKVDAAESLRMDYAHYYREAFASGQDPKTADATATTQLKMKYAVSPVNGNRVMAYAPETAINPKTSAPYYPQVAGSYDWMGKQLDEEVRGAIGRQYGSTADLEALTKAGALPKFGGTEADLAASKEYLAPRALVSDDTTAAEIASGKPPSYHVVYQQPNGQYAALADTSGKPQRFRFDPGPAQDAFNTRAESEQVKSNDVRDLNQSIRGAAGAM